MRPIVRWYKCSLYVGIMEASLGGGEGRAYGPEQRFLGEGFEQAVHGSVGKNPGTDVLVSVRRDEHYGNVGFTAGQLPLQVGCRSWIFRVAVLDGRLPTFARSGRLPRQVMS